MDIYKKIIDNSIELAAHVVAKDGYTFIRSVDEHVKLTHFGGQ